MKTILKDGITVDLSEEVQAMIAKKELVLVPDAYIIDELLEELGFAKHGKIRHRNQNFVEFIFKDRFGRVSINGHQNYAKNCFYVSRSIYAKYEHLMVKRFNE